MHCTCFTRQFKLAEQWHHRMHGGQVAAYSLLAQQASVLHTCEATIVQWNGIPGISEVNVDSLIFHQ